MHTTIVPAVGTQQRRPRRRATSARSSPGRRSTAESWAGRSRLLAACERPREVAIGMATASTASQPIGAKSRIPIAIAPSTTPTPMAAGRLRPARDAFLGGSSTGVDLARESLAGRSLDLQQLAFFVLDQFVDLGVYCCVVLSRSFSACLTSSSPASPSFLMRCSSSIALRRMLRTDTRASSPLALACLTRSRRRSSVSCGMATRMTLPSFDGLTPRSELRIASSIVASAETARRA